MNSYLKNLPDYIFLSLFLGTGLIPNLGALDRIATQWLYLNVLNSLFLLYYLFDYNRKINFKNILNFKPFIGLCLFVFWGLISYLYSINGTEVIVKFIRWFQLPISLFILMIIAKKTGETFVKSIAFLITFILIVELYFTYSTYFDITKLTRYNFSFAYLLKGATGNKNINSASILIKLPFVFYLISYYQKTIIRLVLSVIVFSTSYLIFIISSRAALISFILILILLGLQLSYSLIKHKDFKTIIPTIFISASMLFAFVIFSLEFRDNNTASVSNRISTVNLDDESTSQRIRFYQHSLDQLIHNPIIGVGLGNWKIKSIDYDSQYIRGYIVPYHVHNDFLEIGAELGIVGLGLYLFIIIYIAKYLIKNIYLESKFSGKLNAEIILFFVGMIYFVDAFLNFPHARPVMQVPFVLIIAMVYFLIYNENKSINA